MENVSKTYLSSLTYKKINLNSLMFAYTYIVNCQV